MQAEDGMSERAGLSLRLGHDAGAAMLGRAAVRDLLAQHPTTDELRHDAALVVYELVSNATTHGLPEADGRICLTCEVVGEELVVVVTDGGHNGLVALQDLDSEAARGRGLTIVDALTLSWTVDRSDGTVVRAVVPLQAPAAADGQPQVRT